MILYICQMFGSRLKSEFVFRFELMSQITKEYIFTYALYSVLYQWLKMGHNVSFLFSSFKLCHFSEILCIWGKLKQLPQMYIVNIMRSSLLRVLVLADFRLFNDTRFSYEIFWYCYFRVSPCILCTLRQSLNKYQRVNYKQRYSGRWLVIRLRSLVK